MTLEELAYNTALRTLDKQEAVLEEIRSRGGALLASSAVVTGFLGNAAFGVSRSWGVVVAVLAFAVTASSCAYVLIPRKDRFAFSVFATVLYEQSFAKRRNISEIHRTLTYELERAWKSNDKVMQPLFKAFRLGMWSLILEVMILALLITGTIG